MPKEMGVIAQATSVPISDRGPGLPSIEQRGRCGFQRGAAGLAMRWAFSNGECTSRSLKVLTLRSICRMARKPEPPKPIILERLQDRQQSCRLGEVETGRKARYRSGFTERATPHAVRVQQLGQMVVLVPLGGSRTIRLRP
jgi:hypothetical protein